MEDCSETSNWKEHILSKIFIWKVFKSFVFIVCLTCLLYQSAEFYSNYITYPTIISTEIITDEPFTLPAVTFCYKNILPRSEFCATYPHLCEKPSNLFLFCQERPHFCMGNISALVIPKLGYYTSYSSEVHTIAQNYLFNLTIPIPSYFKNDRMRVTYVEGEQEDVYAKCFSDRLQLFHGDVAVKTMHIDLSLFSDNLIGKYKLHIPEQEYLNPWDPNEVYFSIHSPFMPVNPLYEGRGIRPGYDYFVNIGLKKEYLLPYPYQTDCTNYNVSWMKNDMSGPRSQEACKELCRSNFLKDCFGCDPGRIMIENPADLCTTGIKLHRPYYFWRYIIKAPGKIDMEGIPRYLNVCVPYVAAHQKCHDSCKQDCTKLNYHYSIVESARDPSPMKPYEDTKKDAEIQIYVKNPDVLVLSHKPMYTVGAFYSYIGGLMGCWLGISVWTFAGIFEKSIQSSLQLKRKLHYKKETITKA